MIGAHAAAWLALAWAGVLLWLAIGAGIRRWQLARRFDASSARIERGSGSSVLVMRPCAGEDPALFDNLCSVSRTTSSLPLRVVMAVDDAEDPARPIIERALTTLRAAGIDAELAVVAPRGPNRKASILAALLERHADDIVVNVDSNVDLAGFDFDRLLAELVCDRSIGAIWVPWSERRLSGGLGARASDALLGASLTAFPLLCGIHPNGLVGKFWAARRTTLTAIDFASLVDFLGEDLEMARRLRAAGLRIAVASMLVRSPASAPDLEHALDRYTRWMSVVRHQDFALFFTYPAFFFATPIVLMLALAASLARPDLALLAAGMAVSARVSIASLARHWSARRMAPFDALLADLLLGCAWVRALGTREVRWRGHRLRIEADGRLVAVVPARPLIESSHELA